MYLWQKTCSTSYKELHNNKWTRKLTCELQKQFGVGYGYDSHGLIPHLHCPFNYCSSHEVNFPINSVDPQCAYKRSGLLCGTCKANYSLILGTSQCKQCTNIYLVLLIIFAQMGVSLILLFVICKLTMATGTLSGLVFHVNIVWVHHTIFLPVESIISFDRMAKPWLWF